jgi:hypothetical protein
MIPPVSSDVASGSGLAQIQSICAKQRRIIAQFKFPTKTWADSCGAVSVHGGTA